MPICIERTSQRRAIIVCDYCDYIARLKSRYHNGIVTRFANIVLLNSVAESTMYIARRESLEPAVVYYIVISLCRNALSKVTDN